MAKLSRTALKGLVKECLLEILTEGLAGDSANNRVNLATQATPLTENKKRVAKRKPRRSSADNMRVAHHNHLVESLAGADPVMQDIFNDTLKNNVSAQSSTQENSSYAQRTAHGDNATKKMLNSDPMSLFEGSSNWASLAFSSNDDT